MMLRWCEGTSDANGYRALFGHRANRPLLFNSYASHPNKIFSFRQTDGKTNYTTAAGAYQFLKKNMGQTVFKIGTN